MARVLVVDDDDTLREMVAAVLADEGYAVQTARHGAEALSIVRQTPPDAILLDLMMPVMNGQQFLEEFRSSRAGDHIPVAVMSALHTAAGLAKDMGANGCLAKPFDLDELLAQVQTLLSSRPASAC